MKKFSKYFSGFFITEEKIPNRRRHSSCICKCGQGFTALRSSIKNGKIKGCPGCVYKSRQAEALSEMLGKRFGKWTVTGFSGVRGEFRFYEVKCDCGRIGSVSGADLRRGGSTQCGTCRQKNIATKHGRCGTHEYSVWMNMKQRCKNPKCIEYFRYGGRGISCCKEWSEFKNFFHDMGEAPTPFHQIHRIDNEKGYSKENCIWMHQTEHGKHHHLGISNPNKISKKNIELAAKRQLIGKKFNKWTVLKDPCDLSGYILCRCECGLEKSVWRSNVISGRSLGCRQCKSKRKSE